jgi:hypothetical protein
VFDFNVITRPPAGAAWTVFTVPVTVAPEPPTTLVGETVMLLSWNG